MGLPNPRPGTQDVIRDFPGLTDTDEPQPGGADVQTNLTSARPGEMGVRPGYREVTFED